MTLTLTLIVAAQRLSRHFFMRDFLSSEIAQVFGLVNEPDDRGLAIEAGRRLCDELLEPLQEAFGRIAIRSGFRSSAVNELGNEHGLGCAANVRNYARHIWDRRDSEGCMGAMACIVVPSFLDQYETTGDWRPLAWWVHDHLPYSEMTFFPRYAAFNIGWHEQPKRTIRSFVPPYRGLLMQREWSCTASLLRIPPNRKNRS